MTTYNQNSANDDYYEHSVDGPVYDTDTILAGANYSAAPTYETVSYGLIDTSGIPDTDVISAATFYIYVHSVTASRGVTKEFSVVVGTSGFVGIISASTAGWKSVNVTSDYFFAISKTGDTGIYVAATTEVEAGIISYAFRAYEYDPDGTLDMYLEITHAPPGSSTSVKDIISPYCMIPFCR